MVCTNITMLEGGIWSRYIQKIFNLNLIFLFYFFSKNPIYIFKFRSMYEVHFGVKYILVCYHIIHALTVRDTVTISQNIVYNIRLLLSYWCYQMLVINWSKITRIFRELEIFVYG